MFYDDAMTIIMDNDPTEDQVHLNTAIKAVVTEAAKVAILAIDFTKADGTPRTLIGTLIPSMLPEREEPELLATIPEKPRKQSSAIVLFDLEKKAFRSIKPQSIEFLKAITPEQD